MEEAGFKEGELDEILFMKCRRGESVNRQRIKLQIAVADLHRRMQDDIRKVCPGYVPAPDDVPVITPAMLYIIEREKAWKKIDEMNLLEVRKRVFEKADVAYRKAMVESGDFFPDYAEGAYSVE